MDFVKILDDLIICRLLRVFYYQLKPFSFQEIQDRTLIKSHQLSNALERLMSYKLIEQIDINKNIWTFCNSEYNNQVLKLAHEKLYEASLQDSLKFTNQIDIIKRIKAFDEMSEIIAIARKSYRENI